MTNEKSLYARIQEERAESRKTGDAFAGSVYGSVLADSARKVRVISDGVPDSVVAGILKTYVENAKENARVAKSDIMAEKFLAEAALLEPWIPTQLSEEEISSLAEGHSSLKDFMVFMKIEYGGRYDGALASAVFKARM